MKGDSSSIFFHIWSQGEPIPSQNVQVNHTKTEKQDIERNGQTDWMKRKFLRSLLDMEYDIKWRKVLALGATYNDLKHILDSKRASIAVKIRIMNSHLESTCLCNSELWTITKALEYIVEVFQGNFLRKILKIKCPDKITKEKLYEKTLTRVME